MSLKQFKPVFNLRPRSSRICFYFLSLIHLAGLLVLIFSNMPIVASTAAFIGLLISFAYSLKKFYFLNHNQTVCCAECNALNEWKLTMHDGRSVDVKLSSSTFIHPKLIILNYSSQWKKFVLIIWPDSVSSEISRKLRVKLLVERVSD